MNVRRTTFVGLLADRNYEILEQWNDGRMDRWIHGAGDANGCEIWNANILS